MTKLLLVSIVLFSFHLQAETKLNFSGDAFVKGYFKNSSGPDGTQGFNQYFRLNVQAKPDDELTVKTGLVLSGNTWEGDTRSVASTTTGVDQNGGGGDTTRLDHAFLEYNKNGWITSIGRMAVSSPGMFLTSDDRRDRVQVLKFQNGSLWALIYDKRIEGTLTNSRDDLDMYSINYYAKNDWFSYAIQTGYFSSRNASTFLKDLKQITPQIDGNIKGINYNLYYTLLTGGSKSAFSLYPKTHHSAALVLSKMIDKFKVSYQSIVTVNGGLIADGYDTFSSIVNNSPDHRVSSIKLRTIGAGFGRDQADEQLHVIKVWTQFNNDFSGSLSAGTGKIYVWASTVANSRLESNNIFDATVKYALSKNLSLNALYGKFTGDFKDHAGSLSLNALF